MNEGLFPERDAYDGDPLRPDLIAPCPPGVVASLTGLERRIRVGRLIEQAHEILTDAVTVHAEGHTITGHLILFSGGNDSTVLAHLMRNRADAAVHANTGIGIEQSRQFVRDVCRGWNLELIEEHTPERYEDLVIEHGFPGPAHHMKMFQRLKDRPLMQVRGRYVSNGYRERVVFIAGRRRAESTRRKNIPIHERRDAVIWASPLVMWTKFDMNTYRLMQAEAGDPVPVNEVSDLIHMSGECLCGAYAKPGELEELRVWFPDVVQTIESLEARVRAAGIRAPFDRWGHGVGKPSGSGPLCDGCDTLDLV